MWSTLKKIWHSIFVLTSIVGVLYIPSDVQGLPEAIRPLWARLVMIERESYLFALVLVFGGWIIWNDIRPYFKGFLSRDRQAERDAEQRRKIMFEKTANLRFQLAQQINEIEVNGPLVFEKIEDLHAEFKKLAAKTDVYWGVDLLPNYIQDLHGGFVAAWYAHNIGEEAGLDEEMQKMAFWFFRRGATLAKIHAVKWLQGEMDQYDEYIALCRGRIEFLSDKEEDAINLLAEHCDIDENPTLPKVLVLD